MNYSIKLLPIAYKDLLEAKKWYNQQKENLGEEFKKAVISEIDYIKVYPENYQLKYKELRQSLVKGFPYAIFYLFQKSKLRIIIFGVLHTIRNPEIVRKRMK